MDGSAGLHGQVLLYDERSDFDQALLQELWRKVHAQTWRFGDGPFGEILLPAAFENIVVVLGVLVAFLHDEEVRAGSAHMHARGCTDRTVRVVGRKSHVMRVRHG